MFRGITISCLLGLSLCLGVAARDSVVVINEIHYNPGTAGNALEYVEVVNLFAADIDLTRWALDGAVDFEFPAGTILGGGETLVVASDPAALQNATGVTALGPWTGSLNNSGETLRLEAEGLGPRVMDEVAYQDGGLWPVGADGSGVSLAKRRSNLPGDRASSWQAGPAVHGSPGAVNPAVPDSGLRLNEVSAGGEESFFVEVWNAGSVSEPLGGLVLSSSDTGRTNLVFGAGVLESGAYRVVDESELGYVPAEGERLFLFSAGQAALLDAARVGSFAKARMPDGAERFSRPAVPTPGTSNGVNAPPAMVINEILYNGYPDPGTDGSPADFRHRSSRRRYRDP